MLSLELVRATRSCETAGLCSFIMTMMDVVVYCMTRGKAPVIDFRGIDNPTFPDMGDGINPWERYFRQPFIDVPAEQYRMMSTVEWTPSMYGLSFRLPRDYKIKLGGQLLRPAVDVQEAADQFWYGHCAGKNVLGVRVRGTDYNNLKLPLHQKQPSIQQVCNDIDIMIRKHQVDVIFASTESDEYIHILRERYGDLIISNQNVFFSNDTPDQNPQYVQKNYSAVEIVSMNKEYIQSLLVLARCQYVIAANNNSSELYQFLRKKSPTDELIYNLGRY